MSNFVFVLKHMHFLTHAVLDNQLFPSLIGPDWTRLTQPLLPALTGQNPEQENPRLTHRGFGVFQVCAWDPKRSLYAERRYTKPLVPLVGGPLYLLGGWHAGPRHESERIRCSRCSNSWVPSSACDRHWESRACTFRSSWVYIVYLIRFLL